MDGQMDRRTDRYERLHLHHESLYCFKSGNKGEELILKGKKKFSKSELFSGRTLVRNSNTRTNILRAF